MIYLLHVEDSEADADIVRRRLERVFTELRYRLAQTLREALAMLRDGQQPDVILLDWGLPDVADGMEAIAQLQQRAPNALVFVVTGHVSPSLVSALSRQGVELFHKNSLVALIERLERIGAEAQTMSVEEALQELLPKRWSPRRRVATATLVLAGAGVAGAALLEALRYLLSALGGGP